MNIDRKALLLYAVTDRAWTQKISLETQVELALKGGATCVQLREKNLSKKEFLEEAVRIKKICSKYNTPFFINDDVDVAVECGADGVHIGQSDMAVSKARKIIGEKMILGVSAETVEQALKAEKDGADCIGVGAVFPTDTKQDADSVSIETLKEICSAVKIPVVAIGGINKENVFLLKDSGIAGIAVVSAIFGESDIQSAAENLFKISKQLFN